MKRREFIRVLGGASVAWPPLAGAQQQGTVPTIGVLAAPAEEPLRPQILAFRRGMKDAGFTEGENLKVEYRWAAGEYERLPAMAHDLIERRATVIVALAPPAAKAARAATAAVPIVFVMGADPVELGLVASLNRPQTNVTGVNFLINALGSKRLQLISDMVPTARSVALLINPTDPGTGVDQREMQDLAETLRLQLRVLAARSEQEIEAAFAVIVGERIGAAIVSPDALFTSRRQQLIALAQRHAVPVIYHLREVALDGGLMSYGTSITDAHRLAGLYTALILKGEKPQEMPVQQSTRFEFVINLKTAKALGLQVPSTLLALANEVIE